MSATRKPVVLFITPILRHPPVGGPTLRIENSIKALSHITHLHLYSRVGQRDMGGREALVFLRRYCRRIYLGRQPGLARRYTDRLQSLINEFTRRTFGHAFTPSSERHEVAEFSRILEVARAAQVDVIWLGYGNIAYPLLHHIKAHSQYPVVVDTDSVWSRYVLRGLPYARNEAEHRRIEAEGTVKEIEERLGAAVADVTTAVSEVDADYYRAFAPEQARVHVFSNVIDLEAYARAPKPAPKLRRPCIYLAGTFWHGSPMEYAARWVIEHVLPTVRKTQPELHFYIVGKDSDKVLKDVSDKHITVTGQLRSVLPYLCHADVALVPLKFESGTRFKILEAGACGIPVVSTTLGAEGIAVQHERDILIADTPEEFAACILAVLNNHQRAKALGDNLRKLVATHYSLPVLVEEGQRILDYLIRQQH